MNTHGHEEIASEAGIPLIEEAFSSGTHKPRVTAFYLGNWITDLTQVFDPVAISGGRDKIIKVVEDSFDTAINAIHYVDSKTLLPLSSLLEENSILRQLKKNITDDIATFFDHLVSGTANSPSRWLKIVEPGVLLKGYFKFVQPHESGQYRMDLPSYVGVFNALFRQYYPYEHMDRPVHPAPTPVSSEYVQYDDRLATGPRNSHDAHSISPDLYWYLRDNIQIIAGRLTELDLNWGSHYLSMSPPPDTDLEWNLGLARLGRAIHGIEDFYAHSNFIEHAAKIMGDRYLPLEFQLFDKRRFLKRLKKYNYSSVPEDWALNADEDSVVTGYFDFIDTMFSISHILEEGVAGFTIHPVDGTRHLRTVWDYSVDPERFDKTIGDKIVADFLDVVTNPKRLFSENEGNSVVVAIKSVVNESYLGDVDKFIEALQKPATSPSDLAVLFRAMPVFRDLQELIDSNQSNADSEAAGIILAGFLNLVRMLMVPIQGGRAVKSTYEAIKTVQEFVASPLLWIEKQIAKSVALYLVNVALFFAKESIYESKGMERIGCHSLIAKDHGNEVLYKEMKSCATAVHFYVIKTLLRWRDAGFANRPTNERWVDWLELLEYFTMHPLLGVVCNIEKLIPVSKSHSLMESDRRKTFDLLLKELAVQYQPTTLMPAGTPLDMRAIFKENFSHSIQRNRNFAAAEQALSLLLPSTLAVPLKLRRIIIPHIRHALQVCDPTAATPRWYMNVMKDGWQAIKNGDVHSLKYHNDRTDAEQQLREADNLRKQLEAVYRPT